MSFSSGSSCSWRVPSPPLISGIRMSRRIKSGLTSLAFFKPVRPLGAPMTSKPSERKRFSKRRIIPKSSSTTRMVFIADFDKPFSFYLHCYNEGILSLYSRNHKKSDENLYPYTQKIYEKISSKNNRICCQLRRSASAL